MLISAKELRECDVMPPWYYGMGYAQDFRRVYVFYPIPFNYIVRWWRNVYYLWNEWRGHEPRRRWITESAYQVLLDKEYRRGQDDGRHEGMQMAVSIIKEIKSGVGNN